MTPEEKMYQFSNENESQFKDKSLYEIILAHRIHEHETTKSEIIEKVKLNIKPEKRY